MCLKSPRLGIYHPHFIRTFGLPWPTKASSQIRCSSLSEWHLTFLYLGKFFRPDGYRDAWVALGIDPIVGTNNQYRRVGLAYGEFSKFPESRDLFKYSDQAIIEII